MTELDPLRKRVKELEDRFRNLMTGEGFSVGGLQDAGVPDHWEFRYPPKKQGTGACCFSDGSCSVMDMQSCLDAGGTFLANGTTCDPNPCSDFCTGACCRADGSCDIQRESVCVAGGGTWQGCGTDCDPNPCPQSGACCVGSDCSIQTESDCTDMGGTYQGDGTTCDPNPCPTCTCGAQSPCDSIYYLALEQTEHSEIDTGGHVVTCDKTVHFTYDPDTCEQTCVDCTIHFCIDGSCSDHSCFPSCTESCIGNYPGCDYNFEFSCAGSEQDFTYDTRPCALEFGSGTNVYSNPCT